MAQDYNLPLITDTLTASHPKLVNSIEAVRTSFSGATAPADPLEGQTFWNTSDKVFSIYDGTQWRRVPTARDWSRAWVFFVGQDALLVGNQYTSIQAAVDAVASKRTETGLTDHPAVIRVAPGTYNEKVVLQEKIALIGSGAKFTTLTYSTTAEQTLKVAPDCWIDGFRLENTATDPGGYAVAGSATAGAEATGFSRCEIEHSGGTAIYASAQSMSFTQSRITAAKGYFAFYGEFTSDHEFRDCYLKALSPGASIRLVHDATYGTANASVLNCQLEGPLNTDAETKLTIDCSSYPITGNAVDGELSTTFGFQGFIERELAMDMALFQTNATRSTCFNANSVRFEEVAGTFGVEYGFRLPRDIIREGPKASIWISWTVTTTAGGDVFFDWGWNYIREGEGISSGASGNITLTIPSGSENRRFRFKIFDIMIDLQPNWLLQFYLRRDASRPEDTFVGDIEIYEPTLLYYSQTK